MSETSYSVSEASKLLDVQSHVLRYWEEEMHLPIGRNQMGHRYYTRCDIQVILSIKELKKKGLSLKEIKGLIPFLYGEENMQTESSISDKQSAALAELKPGRKDSEEESVISEKFLEILDRIVQERMHTKKSGEERYKRLDERIRVCQKSRREVAAAIEQEKRQQKGFFRKKRDC